MPLRVRATPPPRTEPLVAERVSVGTSEPIQVGPLAVGVVAQHGVLVTVTERPLGTRLTPPTSREDSPEYRPKTHCKSLQAVPVCTRVRQLKITPPGAPVPPPPPASL